MDVNHQKTLSDLSGHLVLFTSLKPPLSFPVTVQILCLALQLLTHSLENLSSFNFLQSFPAGYQIEKNQTI